MPGLFSPMKIGALTLPNRIILPPMCQYSATDGKATNWHLMHYGQFAVSNIGMIILEASAVEPEGRITPLDLGLWNDELMQNHQNLVSFCKDLAQTPIAVQLGHAGRKGSAGPPWADRAALGADNGGWQVVAPSALSYDADSPTPHAMTDEDIQRTIQNFAHAAKRADIAGYDAIEIHAAHGYLLHQFLSPLSNQRSDSYGGSLENRLRFTLETFKAVRAAFSRNKPVGVRISGSDFVDGGWDVPSTISLSLELKKLGCDFLHISGGGLSPLQKIQLAPGYEVSMAARVKEAVNLPTIAVGLITEAELAAGIIETEQADMVAIGRAMLFNPRWAWHAAAKLGESLPAPNQYVRGAPHTAKGLFG